MAFDLVTVFSGDEVECHNIEREGKILAKFHGVSYPTRDVKENLALKFEQHSSEGFGIGVLHANVGGNPDHDDYAPCSIEDLVSQNMDYWALGHIHAHQILRPSDPAIVYSGNTQARHKNETGIKGCCLVTLRPNASPEIQFVAVDSVRFVCATLDISCARTLDDVIESVQSHAEEISAGTKGRDALIYLTLTGRNPVHEELRLKNNAEDLREQIQSGFDGRTPAIWIELVVATEGTYDVEALKQGNDFIADLLALYETFATGAGDEDLRATLKPVFENWPGRKYLEPYSPEDMQELLRGARNLTLDQLLKNK